MFNISRNIWKKAARMVVNAGEVPFPITDALIEFLQIKMTENEAEFISIFRKSSLNIDQIKKKTDLTEDEILKMLENLMKNGIITGNLSKSTGIMVYTLLPPFPGMIEYSLMKGETGEKEKRLAQIVNKMLKEICEGAQKNYDDFMPQFESFPPFTRVIPVQESVQVGQEIVLLSEEASKLIDNYETIGLTHCYCKQARSLLDEPCKITDNTEVCLVFGKAAKFSIKYGYAKKISQAEAKKIIKKAEDIGLVHKVQHSKLDLTKDLDGICSCCKCCCGIFRLFYEGATPYHTLTSYIANVEKDKCISCGICEEKCQIEAIHIDEIAVIDKDRCIGCAICAHFCPEDAIIIDRTGPRDVFILPPKLNK